MSCFSQGFAASGTDPSGFLAPEIAKETIFWSASSRRLFLTNGCCSSAETNFVLGFNSLFLSQMSLLCVLKQDPSSRKLIYMVFIWRRHLSLSFVSLCSGFDLVYQVPLVPRKHSASLWLINSDDCSRSVFLCEETF